MEFMKTLSLILLALGLSAPLAAAPEESPCARAERISVDSAEWGPPPSAGPDPNADQDADGVKNGSDNCPYNFSSGQQLIEQLMNGTRNPSGVKQPS